MIISRTDGTIYDVVTETLLAYGGAPLSGYTWTVASLSTLPAGTTVDPLTGIFHSSGGMLVSGTHTFDMTVSDGSRTATGTFTFEYDDSLRKQEILKIMNSHYGITIERWLRENCKKKSF